MRKQPFLPRWLLALVGFFCWVFCPFLACAQEPDLQTLELRAKYNRLRAQVPTLKAQGYEVSAVEKLAPRVRQAMQQRRLRLVADLLEEAEATLRQVVSASRAQLGEASRPLMDSRFGIGYGNSEICCGLPRPPATAYSTTGCRLVKFADIRWQRIEPNPPQGGRHTYDWFWLDFLVREWQAAGFNIQILLRSWSTWGTRKVGGHQGIGYGFYAGNVPVEGHWQDYADFVTAVVERYDGDGQADMPGLRAPILYYEIESEAHHATYWQGTLAEYGQLLKVAYRAAKRADQRVQVILSGITIGDIFDDGVAVTEGERRVAELVRRLPRQRADAVRKAYDFIRGELAFGDFYDIVEFHANRSYGGISATAAWIRQQMERHGYNKPIWVGDATSGPPLYPQDTNFLSYPADFQRYLKILDVPSDRNFAAVNRWFRAEQAKLAVKKFVVAFAAGIEKVIMETEVDWPPISQNPFHGLLNQDGSARPVTRSIALLINKIEGFSAVKTLRLGAGIYAFEFTVHNKPIYILWHEDGRHTLVGQDDPSTTVELPFANVKGAVVTTIPTALGESFPQTKVQEIHNGKLRLQVTKTPIFVEGRV